jgi:hypothetical protein
MCCANYCVRRFCCYGNLPLCHSYMGAGAQAFEIAFVIWRIFGIDFIVFLVLIGLYMLLLIMIITATFKDRTWTRKYLTRTAIDNRRSKDILKLRCNKRSAYSERPTPSPRRRGGPPCKHVHIEEGKKVLFMDLDRIISQEWLCWRGPAAV